jgi:hypothetical protein
MSRIQSIQVLDDYRLAVTFADGLSGVVSLRDRLFGPVFEPLRDEHLFAEAFVDEFGAIAWPNGADLAPDAIYERVRASADAPATT